MIDSRQSCLSPEARSARATCVALLIGYFDCYGDVAVMTLMADARWRVTIAMAVRQPVHENRDFIGALARKLFEARGGERLSVVQAALLAECRLLRPEFPHITELAA